MNRPILWHIELSMYSEKVRFALAHKGIEHERRTPLPGLTGPVALRLTHGRSRRMPVMEIDGHRIGDSTAIIERLEAYRPDRPLHPDDPQERTRALALEDFFDEQLAPHVRRVYWFHTLDDTDAVVAAVLPNAGRLKRRTLRAVAPIAGRTVRMDYRIDRAHAEESVAKIHAAMDRVEAELRPSGYLAGDALSVADIAASSLFTPLLAPPGREFQPSLASGPLLALRSELRNRRGGEWVNEIYARHRAGG